jgi:hypothetical protein
MTRPTALNYRDDLRIGRLHPGDELVREDAGRVVLTRVVHTGGTAAMCITTGATRVRPAPSGTGACPPTLAPRSRTGSTSRLAGRTDCPGSVAPCRSPSQTSRGVEGGPGPHFRGRCPGWWGGAPMGGVCGVLADLMPVSFVTGRAGRMTRSFGPVSLAIRSFSGSCGQASSEPEACSTVLAAAGARPRLGVGRPSLDHRIASSAHLGKFIDPGRLDATPWWPAHGSLERMPRPFSTKHPSARVRWPSPTGLRRRRLPSGVSCADGGWATER